MKRFGIRATALALAVLVGLSPAASASIALGDELHGPCLWGDPCKGARFKEHFWVYAAECGKPMDRTEAEAEWDGWRMNYMKDREKEFIEAHRCMFGKEGEE